MSNLTLDERATLIQSYELSQNLKRAPASSATERFSHALSISLMCLKVEIAKIYADAQKILEGLYRSAEEGKIKMGNIQSGVVLFSEHLRYITGIFLGAVVGICSLKHARKLFLVQKASKLQQKYGPDDAAKLYLIGHAIHEFCQKHEIDYRMCSGTVLGAHRQEPPGIIKIDDDEDFVVHPDYNETLNRLLKDGTFTAETGLQAVWQPFTGGWQIFHPDSRKGEGKLAGIGLPFADIMLTMRDEAGHIVYQEPTQRALSAGDYFTQAEWTAQKICNFGPTRLIGMQNPLPYIKRCYGPEAVDFAYQTWHHEDLADVYHNLTDVRKIWGKFKQYGLPRRAYLADRAPITFTATVYQAGEAKIREGIAGRKCFADGRWWDITSPS